MPTTQSLRRRVASLLGGALVLGVLLSPTAARASSVHRVPAGIAADCSANVTQPLQAFLASVPDGSRGDPSVVLFPTGGCYLVDQLKLMHRHYLRLVGQGATLRAAAMHNTPIVYVLDSTHIVINRFRVVGLNPTPGHFNSTYYDNTGIELRGVSYAKIGWNRIVNPWGDLIRTGPWLCHAGCFQTNRHITIIGNRGRGAGRECVSPDDVNGELITRNWFTHCGHDMISGEPMRYWSVRNLTISRNHFGFSGYGCQVCFDSGPVVNLRVVRNVSEPPFYVLVGSRVPGQDRGILIAHNVAERTAGSPREVWLRHVSGAVVRDNTQPYSTARGRRAYVQLSCSAHVRVLRNHVTNAAWVLAVDPPTTGCPTGSTDYLARANW